MIKYTFEITLEPRKCPTCGIIFAVESGRSVLSCPNGHP